MFDNGQGELPELCNSVDGVYLDLCLTAGHAALMILCENLTLTQSFEKFLNGTYTRMLIIVCHIKWQGHVLNFQLYRNQLRVA